MISLTMNEKALYNEKFLQEIPKLKPGVYYVRDFFGDQPSVARIARRFFEEVTDGRFSNVVLNGELSSEGYRVMQNTIEDPDKRDK